MTLVTNMSSKNNLFNQVMKKISTELGDSFSGKSNKENWRNELKYRQSPAEPRALGKK